MTEIVCLGVYKCTANFYFIISKSVPRHRWLIKQRQDTIKQAGNEYVA